MQELFESFFRGLGIEVTLVEITEDQDDIHVRVETPDSSLLIGMHGKNLEIFQHLLGRMAEKKLGKFIHLHLEVNDYMKAKDERLFKFLDSKIAFVQSTGKTIRIPNLTSYERKKAHHYISEKNISGLATKSEGEGTERALHLSYTGELVASAPQSSVTANHTSRLGDDLSEDGVGI